MRRKKTISSGTPLRFEREDGSVFEIPPITRGQLRRVYLRDGDAQGDASHASEDARRADHLKVLLEDARWISGGGPGDVADQLTATEEIAVLHAIIAQHHGFNPKTAAELQMALGKLQRADARGPEDCLKAIDESTLRLAAALREPPATIDAMPELDAAGLSAALSAERLQDAKFQALLHGRKLKP